MAIIRLSLTLLTALWLCACSPSEPAEPPFSLRVTDNGNVLFYNSPVSTRIDEQTFIAYLTRQGRAEAVRINRKTQTVSSPYLIHDYTARVSRSKAFADDHAAPAIIYNAQSEALWAVTAYHTSAAHIYKFDAALDQFILYKTLEGKFTYPRLINHGAQTLLFLRDRPASARRGDLIALSSDDGFTQSQRLVTARDNEVIYAARPFISGDRLAVSYSTLKYTDKKLHDWAMAEFDLSQNYAPTTYDLSQYLPPDTRSNRPTAIAPHGKGWIIATTITRKDHEAALNDNGRPTHNQIAIARFDSSDDIPFSWIYKKEAPRGYYPTSIALNEHGHFLYFNGAGQAESSLALPEQCLQGASLLYPNLENGDFIYVSQNTDDYAIRDFDTSLYFCSLPKEDKPNEALRLSPVRQ